VAGLGALVLICCMARANVSNNQIRIGLNIAYYPRWFNNWIEDNHQPVWPKTYDRICNNCAPAVWATPARKPTGSKTSRQHLYFALVFPFNPRQNRYRKPFLQLAYFRSARLGIALP